MPPTCFDAIRPTGSLPSTSTTRKPWDWRNVRPSSRRTGTRSRLPRRGTRLCRAPTSASTTRTAGGRRPTRPAWPMRLGTGPSFSTMDWTSPPRLDLFEDDEGLVVINTSTGRPARRAPAAGARRARSPGSADLAEERRDRGSTRRAGSACWKGHPPPDRGAAPRRRGWPVSQPGRVPRPARPPAGGRPCRSPSLGWSPAARPAEGLQSLPRTGGSAWAAAVCAVPELPGPDPHRLRPVRALRPPPAQAVAAALGTLPRRGRGGRGPRHAGASADHHPGCIGLSRRQRRRPRRPARVAPPCRATRRAGGCVADRGPRQPGGDVRVNDVRIEEPTAVGDGDVVRAGGSAIRLVADRSQAPRRPSRPRRASRHRPPRPGKPSPGPSVPWSRARKDLQHPPMAPAGCTLEHVLDEDGHDYHVLRSETRARTGCGCRRSRPVPTERRVPRSR